MQSHNDEIQLKDILTKLLEYKEFLLKKKIFIIVSSSLCLIFGVVYVAFISPVKYNAELTFVVESDNNPVSGLGSMTGIANQFGFDLGGVDNSTFSQNNVIELLRTRGVIESALMQNTNINGKKALIIEHYLEINKIKDMIWDQNHIEGIAIDENTSYTHDSITRVIWKEIVENDLVIDFQSDKANIINLSYTSLNEEFAKDFVEKLIDQMSKMYTLHQTAQANNTLDFLQERSDSVFLELKIAEEEFAKVKDINQRIIKASGRLKELQLMRRVEVLNTMYLQIVKNLELSKISLLNKIPIINVIDKPILPLETDRISKTLAGLVGFLLGGFFSVCYFIFRKLFTDALTEG